VPNSWGRGAVCASRRNGHLYQSTEFIAVQNGAMQEQDRSQMLYPQIAESIAMPIRAGTLARGERVPSVRESRPAAPNVAKADGRGDSFSTPRRHLPCQNRGREADF
jgi:hypothetical protein